jgi:hypothetical protein
MVDYREISPEDWQKLESSTKQSPWDEFLDAVSAGKIMQVDMDDPKKQRGTRMTLSRRAKQRGITLEYRPTATGLAVRQNTDLPASTSGPSKRGRKRKTTLTEE